MYVQNHRWNSFDTSIGPIWVPKLCSLISEINPPNLGGKTVYISTDYGVDNAKSKYSTISILAFDLEKSIQWEYYRKQIRMRYLADGRRMSFKSLNDRNRRQALDAFLQATDSIYGLSVTIAIDKDLEMIVAGDKFLQGFQERFLVQGKWNSRAFDNMLRIVWLVSIIVAGVSKPYQNIYWISDEDKLFGNPTLSADVTRIASHLANMYIPYPLGELGIGTTSLDEGDRMHEDLASIPDLASGCAAELTTQLSKIIKGNPSTGLAYSIPYALSSKSRLIASWLGANSPTLRKGIIVMDKIHKDGLDGMRIYRLRME
jgi:hypothetical protein